MSTIRSQIIAAVDTVLATASSPVFPEYDPVEQSVASGIIFGDWLDKSETNNMLDKHALELPMGFFARGATADAVADALQDEVVGALQASAELKALINRLIPGPVRGRRDGSGKRTTMLSQTLMLEFMTQRGSQAEGV